MLTLMVIAVRLLWLSVRLWAAGVEEHDVRVYEACVRPGSEISA